MTMLGMTNKKKTAMGGIGIAVLLTLLMALTPMTGLVGNPIDDSVMAAEQNQVAEDDAFAQPEKLEPVDYGFADSSEVVGARDANMKTFRNADGTFTQMISDQPIHYDNDGTWSDIDLNLKATAFGWEVVENTFNTAFSAEVANGVVIQPSEWDDAILTGLNPMLVVMDESGTSHTPFEAPPATSEVTVGGNTIRYPLAEGFDLDYEVNTFQVKQNLVIRERPILDEGAHWFGFTEAMRLPAGHALYSGEVMVGSDLVQTDGHLEIRNVETGDLYAEIPAPMVIEPGVEEPYFGTFFVMSQGPMVFLTTAVETSWLLDDERVFPLGLDPTLSVTSAGGGYCYVSYNNCYNSNYRYMYHNSYNGKSSSTFRPYFFYTPWHKFTFSSSNALPTGASVDKIEYKEYVSYHYSYLSNSKIDFDVKIMEDCGTTRPATSATGSAPTSGYYYYQTYSGYSMGSPTCSGAISTSYLTSGYGGTAQKAMIVSAVHSPGVDFSESDHGTGWKTAVFCDSTGTTSCSSSTQAGYIWSALNGTSSVGLSKTFDNSLIATSGTNSGTRQYVYTYAYTSGSSNNYLALTYSGGTDSDAPTATFGEYDGITSYIEGERTFFLGLSDTSGIDTTSGNEPTLYYAINNGSYTSVAATTIGTCSTSSPECQFKAQTSDITAGDYVTYYWWYQDLNVDSTGAADPNEGYTPALTGSQTTPTPYWFFVDDINNAGDAKKMVQLSTEVSATNLFSPTKFFDRQMSYFDQSDEYYFEFDTSDCGTGSSRCFFTGSASQNYFYNNWIVQWQTSTYPATSSYNTGGSSPGKVYLDDDNGGFLSISADDGPGMNLVFLWDGDEFAMVGIGDETSIEEPLSGGSTASQVSTYGYTAAHRYVVPGDITGDFAGYSWNATYSSTGQNVVCTGTNGWTHFLRSSSGSPSCSSGYYYVYNANYKWNGFALGAGYYARTGAGAAVTYDVMKIAPEPDTYAPTITHTSLADSYARSRTVTATIADGGSPPAGLNVSTTAGTGPTLYYSVNNGSTMSQIMTPVGKTTTQCVLATCDWSADITNLNTSDYIEYYITAEDVSTDVTTPNSVQTTASTFEVGDPNKMFIVEWHDMGYTNSYLCTYQVVFYDVTNEFEFKYDTGCQVYVDYSVTGYQDQTRAKGETLQKGNGWLYGSNPFTTNYRMHTSSTSNGHESFSPGLTEIKNYDTALSGSSSGTPYGYYCAYSWYWNTYKSSCNANIDMPDDFDFEYFGTLYEGTDSNDRIRLGRQGYMYFIDNGATSLERGVSTWSSNFPSMPYSGNSASRPGTIAPWWGYYTSYYCYDNTAIDCSVRYRTMPYNGKGTDIDADITTDTTWDIDDSPIRINPSNDYLSVSADLTIQPGVVVQVANGKGISFDGTCDEMKINGNEANPVTFEGQAGADWKGLAFTAACTTGTDDRHEFSHVDFRNTSDAAIAAGSRHGSSPSTNANVGNFTMNDVTFTNVAAAFEHGSGQGTVVEMTNFAVDGADDACFNFAEDTVAILREGSLKNCNTNGQSWGGAIVNYPGSTAGSLFVENVTVTNSYVNFIDVDLQDVTVSNVSVSNSASQTGVAIDAMHGTNADVYLYNVSVPDYANSGFNAVSSVYMDDVDFGSADLWITPNGWGSSTVGPVGDDAVMMNVESGDITMQRIHFGVFEDISAGDVSISGTTTHTETETWKNLDIGDLTINGGAWSLILENADVSRLYSFSTSATNTIVMEQGSTIDHDDSSVDAVYGRNSEITLASVEVTSSDIDGSSNYLAKASSNSDIVLIDVSYDDGTGFADCADASGDTSSCPVDVSSSATVWYGGLAQVSLYREALINSVVTKVYKSGHSVRTTVMDTTSSPATPLLEVGVAKTDTTGMAEAWVISGDSDGNAYGDHNIFGWGAAGQNETEVTSAWYPTGGFGFGDQIELLLQPAPINFDQPNMDCAWMANNQTFQGAESSPGVYLFDSFPMTLSADLDIDGCTLVMMGSVMTVDASATSSPVLTISNGGSLVVNVSSDTGGKGTIKAQSSSYGVRLDVADGTLSVAGGVLKDLHQDSTTMSALYIGSDGALVLSESAEVYGAQASDDDMATVKIDRGSVSISDSTIINTANTGTALWVEGSAASIDNIVVKNGAVGIMSKNAAPQIDGFTSTDNTVGVDMEGGMSLPTIYRSPSLAGVSTGWQTYDIDLSAFIGNSDYLQVGANSIYAGGNAHPYYNYWTSKYYFITDRYRMELTDNAGNTWNISAGDTGYYPYSSSDPNEGVGDVGTYQGGAGGVPQWDCNYYGVDYGPNRVGNTFYGGWGTSGVYWYFTGQSGSYPNYYNRPAAFGFNWENIDGVTPSGSYAYYPYHYWGFGTYSWAGWSGVMVPPEGLVGTNNYNVCVDYAYSYYMSSGQGARVTFPIVDISASNLTSATMYIDVLHNRANNYQDRYEFVARSGNDPADLGDYKRESGTPLFKDGTINGADIGVEIGGDFAAGHLDTVEVNSPNDAGIMVDGSTMASADGVTVNGGDYGVLVANGAAGSMDLENMDLDSQTVAGMYYVKDFGGDFSGTVSNSAGAAMKFGSSTTKDLSYDSVDFSGNNVGFDLAGSGGFTFVDSTMGSTSNDFKISGSSVVDFVEGTVDSTSVDVTGSGEFNRMRQLDVTMTADQSDGNGAVGVSDVAVVLRNAEGATASSGTTGTTGVAEDLTFTSINVDAAGLHNIDLNGYSVSSVAMVDYYWNTASDSNADFRYVEEAVSLSDTSGNAETVELIDEFDHRVCYSWTSASYNYVNRCANGWSSTGSSREFANGLEEHGYYYGSVDGGDFTGKAVMIDAPNWYLDGDTYEWNGTTMIWTGSWSTNDLSRVYPRYNGEVNVYMHDSTVQGMSLNDDGELAGINFGYLYYSMNLDANNTEFSGIASIVGAIGYGYYSDYELNFFNVRNSTISHYKGWSPLNNAIQSQDMCMRLYGGDGNIIEDNTFNDCAVGIEMQRSPYYWSHNSNEIGADNVSIRGNTFEDGGEISDVRFYPSASVEGAVVTDNVMNNTGGLDSAISAWDSTIEDLTISGNTIRGFTEDGIYLNDVKGFEVSDNDMYGPGNSYAGIHANGGYGDIMDNVIVDATTGILMSEATQPVGTTTDLCEISGNYGYSDSCTFNFAGNGSTLVIDIETDSWGYEISLEITKPDGTKDSWSTYTFSSNTAYKPLTTYTDAGTYTIDVSDSWGDGGITLDAYYTSAQSGVTGPVISGNDVSMSPGSTVIATTGILVEDCTGTAINMADNFVAMPTDAIVADGCDFIDENSELLGGDQASTSGVVSASGDAVTLSGTTISGFDTGVESDAGTLSIIDNATIAGVSEGVWAYDTQLLINYAELDGGTSGVGLLLEDSGEALMYCVDLEGAAGMEIYNTDFRYNMGDVNAETAIFVSDSVGKIENLTWTSAVTTQIELDQGAMVTSIGQDLTPSLLVVPTGTMIDEANLLDIAASHLSAPVTSEVGVSIVSTDGLRAAYISPDFQSDAMAVDGDNADWVGSELNPSDDAMPGELTENFYVTYTENDDLYVAIDGLDLSTSDLLVYFDVTGGGSDTGYDYGASGAHDLPFEADFVYWAESDASNDLYAYGFLGWGVTSLSADNVDADFSGDFAEIMVPFSRLGGMPSSVRMIAIVQSDSSADVSEVYPDQAMDSTTTLQDFSEYYTVVLGANNLQDGVLEDEVLTYRTFLGSNVPSAAKEYDVMIKHTNDDCAVDWATENAVNMSDNVALSMDIERACPSIGSDLANITVNEDSGAYTVSLTSYASDVQDAAGDLTWAVDEGETVVVYGNTPMPAEGLVSWSLTGHDLSITPTAEQFGMVQFNFTVTDSNGLEDDRSIYFIVENVNDAPEICQRDTNGDCVDTVMLFGDAAHVNYIPEDSLVGGQSVSVILSDVANTGSSALNLIKDQPNENDPSRQVYTWGVTVDETCPLFSVGMVDDTVLTVTGKSGMDFEAGGSCDITLSLSDDGAENQNAVDEVITISVVPVNDAPTIDDWNLQTGDTINWASNDSSLIYGEWTIRVLEDTEAPAELTFDLSALKNDVDHDLSDLTWSLLPKLDDNGRAYCAYTNYFSFTFNGDELVLDLVKDATTNAPINQIDYLYNGGVHQVNPAGKGFCEMELYLTDSAAAPTGFAYDLNDNGYIQQTSLKRDVKIIVQNVAEQVPDYYFEANSGFDFNGVSNVMDGTWVPVTVTVTAGGDEGPYNHDSMLMITFQSDGHAETERDAIYIDAPAYGQSVTVDSEVFVKAVTTTVWAEMDVKTCVDETCDMTKSVEDRFIADEPASHGKVTLPNGLDYWAEPGFYGSEDGTDSIRRPVLEDKDWCNNVMYNALTGNIDVCDQADYGRGSFEITDQELPDVVRTIGASGVPSFAPSIVAVALAGMVVGLLALAGRREEDEEEEEESSPRFVEDEAAVSPVIATILMVAITVVLSGVIYVWASSLAETDVKGVPRITFQIEDVNAFDAETGHWKIEVQQSETELATQAVEIKIFAAEIDGVYEVKMANSDGVYGFSPYNSDSLVTFSDSVRSEGDDKVSTFFVGDTIFVRTHLADGTPLTDVTIQLSYAPEIGQGALLRTWSGLSYDLAA